MKLSDMGTFFLQIPPGLEAIGERELLQKTNINEENVISERGGLSIECTLETALTLNRLLKVPNRVLLRLMQFKCRDLPKLFSKVSKENFKLFNAGQEFTFKVSSQNSRLFDSRKIEKTLKEAFLKSFQAYPPKKKESEKITKYSDWTLFCRLDNDLCTLSLDLSGERLGKRGYKKSSGLAPMRENLAAAMWSFFTYDLNTIEEYTVIDPYAGSGTMLFEAALFNNKTATRFYNGDVFGSGIENSQEQNSNVKKLIAIDQNEDQIHCLKLNNNNLKLPLEVHQKGNTQFDFSELPAKSLVFTNPPYQKRVSGSVDIWNKQLNVERIGLVLPKENFPKIVGYTVLRELPFKHGGKDVVFKVFIKS